MIDEIQQVDVTNDASDENDEILSEIGEILNRQQIEGETNLDELLAIIAEIGLDKKEILNKIKNVSESEGIALYGASKDTDIAILVGNKIKTCIAKENIEKYEIVKFISSGPNNELAVVLLKTYAKDILNTIEEIDFATSAKQLPNNHEVTANAGTDLNTSALALESGGNLDTIAAVDFATETTLDELNNKVESVDEGDITKVHIKDTISQDTLKLILLELQKINIHLSLITDNEIKESDINDD